MQIYIATGNKNKVNEIKQYFKKLMNQNKVELLFTTDIAPELAKSYNPIESADTFSGNAYIKAYELHKLIKKPVIADDSGLEVDALNGAPGVHSARYAETDEKRISKLLHELTAVQDRTARFICSICFIDNNGNAVYFNGRAEGSITHEPAGEDGFGYDPVFLSKDAGKTFSEINMQQKSQISHRGKALRNLIKFLDNEINH